MGHAQARKNEFTQLFARLHHTHLGVSLSSIG